MRTPRSLLACASTAQCADVRRRHKSGQSLRRIAEDTSLGLSTARTIVAQGDGRDRTTIKHLQRILPPSGGAGSALAHVVSTVRKTVSSKW